MAKAGRGQTRRDSKRRVLRLGESVRADGKYQYKDNLTKGPEIFNQSKLPLSCAARQEWEIKSKAFKITITAKYNEINFLTGGEENVSEKLAENLINKTRNEKIKYCIAELKNKIEPNRLIIEEIKK